MPETEADLLLPEEQLPKPQGEALPEERVDFSRVNMDELCTTAGGAFRATSMMQKRLRDIVRFAPDQIAGKVDNKMLLHRVMHEIIDKQLSFDLAPDVEDEEEA